MMASLYEAKAVTAWALIKKAGKVRTYISNGQACVNIATSLSGRSNGNYRCRFYGLRNCLGFFTDVRIPGVDTFWFGRARSIRCY